MKETLLGKNLAELQELVLSLGLPKFTAGQIAQWMYRKRVRSIDEMTNLSKDARAKLSENYELGLVEPVNVLSSADGTKKYLFPVFEKGEASAVEAVMIPDGDRATLCVSSQSGCRMGCKFCMTGRQGFHGNLTANQIINQVLSVPETHSLTNVVFMGMGEPTDNVDNVLKVIEILTSDWGLGWSPKRVTVSSVGSKIGLKEIVEKTSVHIALSVHNAIPDERLQMMPVEKPFPVKQVLEMLGKYDFAHQRRLSIEYIMWQWFNDDIRHAEALREIIPNEHVRVNLIRYHMIPGIPKLRTSSDERMAQFRDYLNSHGVTCTIRRSRGEDIEAACGMLAGKVSDANAEADAKKKKQ